MQRMDVVIVGGGFTGLTTAAALSAKGARVQVLEASATWANQFRGELIHPKGVRALDSLGLAAPLFEAGGVEVHGFAATPSATGPATLLPYTKGAGLGVDHPLMVTTLRREVAARPNVTITTSCRVDDFLREGSRIAGVRTADGREHRAALVVVADGRNSRLRGLLGLQPEVRLLSYTAAFGVEGELPHGRLGHVFLGAPGPILAYPYAPGKMRFCVDVPLGAPKGREAIVEFLMTHYAPAVPEGLREAMHHSLRTTPFEMCATHAISTENCAAPGVALVGDAGGCAHPLTASGMTNAMNDVLTLADVVSGSGATDDALRRYQRRRYDFVRMRELFTDALYEVFKGQDAGSRALQTGVFTYWNSSERSRNASMDILSGEDVRPSHFVSEYTRVFGLSAIDVLSGRRPGSRMQNLSSLVKTTYGRLEHVANRTAKSLVERYRRDLHRVTA
jgi:2-polyprenyl-6-methoxyphenol hydroxylase-like FAD-dependent oxidoreductase